MPTYLCTWNPSYFDWPTLKKEAATIRKKGLSRGQWSVGSSKKIQKGDRIFLLRQGKDKPGVVASGHAASIVYTGEHWGDPDKVTNYVDIDFDVIRDPSRETILDRELLLHGVLAKVHWSTQMSGIQIAEEAVPELERVWRELIAGNGAVVREEKPVGLVPKLFRAMNGSRCVVVDEHGEHDAILIADSSNVPIRYRDNDAKEHPIHFIELHDDEETMISGQLANGQIIDLRCVDR